MKRKLIFILSILLLFVAGCNSDNPLSSPVSLSSSSSKTNETEAPLPSATPENKKPNISFVISSFSIGYENNSSGEYFNESFSGEGIITVNGDPELLKKAYYVLVDIKNISGGSQKYGGGGIQNVIVTNGLGRFTTSDWNSDEKTKMVKPKYEARIIGYIAYEEYIADPITSQ
jgi:hypothetical protein